jgi:hypothetical protein
MNCIVIPPIDYELYSHSPIDSELYSHSPIAYELYSHSPIDHDDRDEVSERYVFSLTMT